MKRLVICISLALLATMVLPNMASAATLSQRVRALEKAVAALKAVNKTQSTQITTLQNQLAAVQSNNALALGPYVSVTTGTLYGTKGPNIVLTGANVHIVDGSGTTNDQWNTPLGLGNLIVGYNHGTAMTGSHYIVCGEDNSFTGWGGFVAGFGNTVSYAWSTVTGGIDNAAGGSHVGATVSGGYGNTASGYSSAVSGGQNRTATGTYNWVAGGLTQAN
jgi:hypothetical protein